MSPEIDPTRAVIPNPEKYEEMKKKLLEREEEQLNKLLAKRKAKSELELKDIASKNLVKRTIRASSEHKTLKDRTVLRDPKNEDITALKHQLNEEIKSISKRILATEGKQESGNEESHHLKGRISPPHDRE